MIFFALNFGHFFNHQYIVFVFILLEVYLKNKYNIGMIYSTLYSKISMYVFILLWLLYLSFFDKIKKL